MTVKDSYAWEKFLSAVTGMAVSAKPLQGRIADAFSLSITRVHEENLTGDLADIWWALEGYRKEWDEQPGGDEGTIAQWAESLSEEQASEVAHWIVDAYDRLAVAVDEEE
jgi:hypothetical protein